jgi:hypothetical protein
MNLVNWLLHKFLGVSRPSKITPRESSYKPTPISDEDLAARLAGAYDRALEKQGSRT